MTVTRAGIARGLMLGVGMAGLSAAAPASAQFTLPQTWVSGTGDDNNVCSRTAPCLTFAGAIGKTAAGGEINCLDQGAFGPVTIEKAITIDCEGVGTAGVRVSSGDGITVKAGSDAIVVIDGLDINGSGSGSYGIRFTSGAALIVRNTVIRNLMSDGIGFYPNGQATLSVDGVKIDNVGGNRKFFGGIDVLPSSAQPVRATIVRSQISNSSVGVIAYRSFSYGPVFISMRSITVTNSSQYGVYAYNNSSNVSESNYASIAIDDSTVSGSGSYGLYASGQPAGMLVNNSTITNNIGGGLFTDNGGVIYSYGNNRVNGNNKMDGSFTATIAQR